MASRKTRTTRAITPRDTPGAILEAAALEFSEHGFSGARMEAIARRAGVNKALVYRHFGDKDGVFRAALKRQFEHRSQILDALSGGAGPVADDAPDGLAEMMIGWTESSAADPHFMRLIQREALHDDGGPLVEERNRRAYYARQIEMLRAMQRDGTLDPAFEAPELFLALLSIVVFPSSFPQITRLALGHPVDSDAFRTRWAGMLRKLTAALRSLD